MKLLATILMAMALSTSAFGGAGVPPTLPPPGLPYTVGVTPPVVASFTGILTSGAAPHTVCFTDQSTGTATAWAWTFGDGGTSTLRDPCHTYTVPGVYTVTLNVTCNEGSDDIVRTNYITVTGWPVVTSVSGTISHGSTVTLTGASFGVKAQAAPLTWDDFEGGSDGALVDAGSKWTKRVAQGGDFTTQGPTYSATAARSGSLGMLCDPFQNGQTGVYTKSMERSGSFAALYIDGWYKNIKASGQKPRSYKPINVFNNTGGLQTNHELFWQVAPDCGPSKPNPPFTLMRYLCDASLGGWWNWGTNMSFDAAIADWVHVQIEYVDALASDGYYKIWYNGVLSNSRVLPYTSGCNGAPLDQVWIGLYLSGDAYNDACSYSGPCRLDVALWDDLYIDNSIARVEIGNAPTYAACTHREIQVPSAWANGSITVTVNAGTLDPGTAYLFVVDSAGRTSAGREVTIVAP